MEKASGDGAGDGLSLRDRNMLRTRITEIANGLEGGEMTPASAALALHTLAAQEAAAIEEDEIQFDLDEILPQVIDAAFGPTGRTEPADPVTAALLEVIHLHDRNAALRIAGDQIVPADLDAYRAALARLHAALSREFPS